MASRPAVSVQHLFKEFLLPHERHSSLKQAAVNVLRRIPVERLRVLEDVSFEVASGEFFGIVGRNGSGKSTLLKILADIYVPTSGRVAVQGRVAPFVELGVGFNPELTGRDNVFLNGAIFGMSRQELIARYDSIVAFAELEQFMDQKLKNYSTGMQVRLAFSIAIQADADVTIMDEVLAVGDAAFQVKCFDSFRQLKAEGRTVILVTHDMGNIERFCDRVLVLERGVTHGVMSPRDAALAYNRLNDLLALKAAVADDDRLSAAVAVGSVTLLCGPDQRQDGILEPGQELTARVRLKRTDAPTTPVACTVSLERDDGLLLARVDNRARPDLFFADELLLRIPALPAAPGNYAVKVALSDRLEQAGDERPVYAADLEVTPGPAVAPFAGVLHVDSSWSTP